MAVIIYSFILIVFKILVSTPVLGIEPKLAEIAPECKVDPNANPFELLQSCYEVGVFAKPEDFILLDDFKKSHPTWKEKMSREDMPIYCMAYLKPQKSIPIENEKEPYPVSVIPVSFFNSKTLTWNNRGPLFGERHESKFELSAALSYSYQYIDKIQFESPYSSGSMKSINLLTTWSETETVVEGLSGFRFYAGDVFGLVERQRKSQGRWEVGIRKVLSLEDKKLLFFRWTSQDDVSMRKNGVLDGREIAYSYCWPAN